MELNHKSPCHVLLVGAGLAGLASALALRKAGHRATVFERMPKLRQVRFSSSTLTT